MVNSKDCPVCRLTNPSDAIRCDCGYDFKAKIMRKSYLGTKYIHKNISIGIIIFVVLSSIITILVLCLSLSHRFSPIPGLLFTIVNIIAIGNLIQLKNWARIAYIIIHIILALLTLLIFFISLGFACGGVTLSIKNIIGALISLTPFFFSIIAIIYFLRSDTVKLFKQ